MLRLRVVPGSAMLSHAACLHTRWSCLTIHFELSVLLTGSTGLAVCAGGTADVCARALAAVRPVLADARLKKVGVDCSGDIARLRRLQQDVQIERVADCQVRPPDKATEDGDDVNIAGACSSPRPAPCALACAPPRSALVVCSTC